MSDILPRKFGDKRGISPIMATLLLIVIAIAAIIVTYAWITAYMGGATRRAGEELIVENIKFHDNNKVSITLRNTGTSDVKIVAIYVGNSSTSLTNATNINPALPQLISAGTAKEFTVTLDYNYDTGTRYYFKVVTASGYILPFNEKP